jgi:site-specific DNA-methyltransferase (adenine-specific)
MWRLCSEDSRRDRDTEVNGFENCQKDNMETPAVTEITTFCGDARLLLAELPDEGIDLIVTDPPYPVISGGSGPTSAMHRRPAGMLSKNDGRIFENNDLKFSDYLPDLYRVLKSPAHLYLMVNFLNLEAALNELRAVGFQIHNLLVWQKNNATPNRWYMKNVEYVIFARKGLARAINSKGSKTCHQFDNIIGNKTHPTEKPVALMRHYVENSSKAGDVVLDPFMGTGAVGVACKELERNFIGFEVDESFYKIATERLRRA